MKTSIHAMEERLKRSMAQITALLCMLFLLGFVFADYAFAKVKPPVHLKFSTDFVHTKGGPHIHVAKKNEVVNIKIEISSGIDIDNADFELRLPEGWEFVSGHKTWKGRLQKNGTVTLKATVRATGDNFGVIEGRLHLSESCSDIEGMLDLRDPGTSDRVPEWGETTDLPEDVAPERLQGHKAYQVLPESLVSPAHPNDAGVQDSCTVRAYGRLVYQDDLGNYIGLSGARVVLYDEDDDWDDECAIGITDWDGYYDLTGSCGDPWNPFGDTEAPDIYIQNYAINTNYVQVGDPYTSVNPTINEFCGTYDYGTRAVPAAQAGAYQIFNQGVQANMYIDTYAAIPPMVKVNWPAGEGGSWYDGEINIGNPRTWFEPSMYHEYGHFIMDKYAALPSFNYCNSVCDASSSDCGHCLWAPENGYIHWMEGWPDFFADVQSSYWGRNNLYGFESHQDPASGSTDMIEGFTAAVLWDIFDSAQDNQHSDTPSDQLSLGFDEIWNVTTNYDPGGTYNFPETIHEFWNGFYSLYPGYRLGLWSVYAEHHIVKACPETPVTPTLLSPADGATYVSLTPYLDWGDVSGATSYDVQVSTNNTFSSVVGLATVSGSGWSVSPALTANTIYYWRVRAKNACATGPWSSSYRYFRTAPTCSALNYPTSKWQRVWRSYIGSYCLGDGPDESNVQFDNQFASGIAYGRTTDIQFSSSRSIYFAAGTYRFTVGSDDGERLWIDGVLKLDRWIDRPYATDTVDVTLTAGYHNVRLDYYQNGGGARVSFAYVVLPDLIVQSISTNPATPGPGQTVNVTMTVKNQGAGNAGPFYVDFYMNRTTAPTVGVYGEVWCNLSGLAAGATTTCTQTVSYSAGGTYSMWALVDSEGAVAETSESNNVLGPQTISVDAAPPDTAITAKPAKITRNTAANFTFTSSEAGSTFKCRLDGSALATCPNPKAYTGLAEGTHTFAVKAVDQAGNIDATAAPYTWTIDLTPPTTTITGKPSNPTTSKSATFTFTSSEANSTFKCRLDDGAFAACPTTKSYYGLAAGMHTFKVKATDKAGNADPTPASYSWGINP